MDYLPIFAKLDSLPCLVIGGGDVAWRKIRMLKKAGANVSIVAFDLVPSIQAAVEKGDLVWRKEAFIPEHLNGMFLVIAATDDPLINESVLKAGNARQIFVNVVDDTSKSSFIVPSIVDRNPLLIAISSSGHAPVLARLLREKFESLIPSHFGRLAKLAGAFRQTLKSKMIPHSGRRKFWETAFNGRFNTLVAQGDEKGANAELERLSEDHAQGSFSLQGEVALIGAGPGSAGLLTLRGLQLMQEADVVLYDALVSDEILELCRRDASLICVGKRAASHSVSQNSINEQLVTLAREGKRVVRLKGGDPFMFGRGGEELQALKKCGIPFQVVPGITAGLGGCAYAGIPLTHQIGRAHV